MIAEELRLRLTALNCKPTASGWATKARCGHRPPTENPVRAPGCPTACCGKFGYVYLIHDKIETLCQSGNCQICDFQLLSPFGEFPTVGTFELFIKHLDFARRKYEFKLYGYVIMPEHVHLVMYPAEGSQLGLIIGEIKSKMARVYFSNYGIDNGDIKRVFWQKRCYDHNCRTFDTVMEKINYCHNNPVTRGLVVNASDWEWSSFNFYQGRKDVPILMDKIEL